VAVKPTPAPPWAALELSLRPPERYIKPSGPSLRPALAERIAGPWELVRQLGWRLSPHTITCGLQIGPKVQRAKYLISDIHCIPRLAGKDSLCPMPGLILGILIKNCVPGAGRVLRVWTAYDSAVLWSPVLATTISILYNLHPYDCFVQRPIGPILPVGGPSVAKEGTYLGRKRLHFYACRSHRGCARSARKFGTVFWAPTIASLDNATTLHIFYRRGFVASRSQYCSGKNELYGHLLGGAKNDGEVFQTHFHHAGKS